MLQARLRELAADAADPARLIPAVSAGLVLGLLAIVVELSLASLIFSGPLAGFAARAAGLTLFGSFICCLVVALGSGLPMSVSVVEDAPTAILGSVAAGIAASLAATGTPQQAFVTVGAAMVVSTLVSAGLFLLMGRFGLGNLMRYMPYPVVGGFMAGIGWLLVSGGVSIVAGAPLTFAGLRELCTVHAALRLAPAVALALALLVGLNRLKSMYVLPAALLLALGCFVAWLLATGVSLTEAKSAGLLLGDMPSGALWPVFSAADRAVVRWDALIPQLPQLCTIPLVSAISLLLISSGLETATRQDVDLKRELYVNALANLIIGPAAAPTGYTALSFSMLGPATGSNSRLVGVVGALVLGAATFFGAATLSLFPRFILGGLVIFLGVATLLDWAVATRPKVTRVEYALILAILCAIGLFGFLSGVGFGLLAAAIIFVVQYSRLPVVRQTADATTLSSARNRPVPDQHLLRARGQDIRVLKVAGYLFFGSANALSQTVAECIQARDSQPAAGQANLILDFSEVTGFDSSAVNCFLRMLQRCDASGWRLAFAAPPQGLETQMRRAEPAETDRAVFAPDLDRALELCEDAILEEERARLDAPETDARDQLFDSAVDDMMERLEQAERFESLVERLGPHLLARHAQKDEVLLRQGDEAAGLLLFVSGQAEETRIEPDGRVTRLRTLGPGCIAGHSQPVKNGGAPGTVTALTDCAISFLPAEALARLENEDPGSALALFALLSSLLESRLADTLDHAGRG